VINEVFSATLLLSLKLQSHSAQQAWYWIFRLATENFFKGCWQGRASNPWPCIVDGKNFTHNVTIGSYCFHKTALAVFSQFTDLILDTKLTVIKNYFLLQLS